MDVILLAVVIVAWTIGAVVVAALVSDFRRAETRGRAWIVLFGGVLLAVGPLIAEALLRGYVAIGQAVFVSTLIFGVAATLMYAVVLIGTALVQLYRRCVNRRRIAV